MYLQITTKCNMKCAHCCYSCNKNGKHMDYQTAWSAIQFIRDEYCDETISVGGGEPTLHPRFFDILNQCLKYFDYVWMATNGSQTKAMYRLHNIINGCDYESFEREDYCQCGNPDDCYCEPKDLIYQEDKLSVALSLDHFHSPINQRIEDLWRRNSLANKHHYEIRNVTSSMSGIIAQGRAKRTGSGWNTDECVCPDIFIRPDGKLKACGCNNSPIIGDIWNGVEDRWLKVIQSDAFSYANCFNSYLKRTKLKEAA